MNYLLDTCVLSEFTCLRPDQGVLTWLDSLEEENLFISVITVGEIQRGIERLPDSHRKTGLLTWMNTGLMRRFAGRILWLDTDTMLIWGALSARLDAAGQPMSTMDSLIAATALQHHLIVVTRNTADFIPSGVQLINLWN